MKKSTWTRRDLVQMASLGIDPHEASRQLSLFKNPPPFVRLDRPALLGDGIRKLTQAEIRDSLKDFDRARRQGRFLKFVPASGAASRMFFLISKFLHRPSLHRADLKREAMSGEKESEQLLSFVEALPRAAFWEDLKRTLANKGLDAERLRREGRYHELLSAVLFPEGLDYSRKPKGLIKFHAYGKEGRTPVEEHLVESSQYVKDSSNRCRIHFTISPEHAKDYRRHFKEIQNRYEGKRGVWFEIDFSTQEPSTSTLAVDVHNRPFRDRRGQLVFRPAGHGALISNLHRTKGDIVFIKNVDNVVMEPHLDSTVHWKKVLGGFLVGIQQKIFNSLKKVNSGKVSSRDLAEIEDFIQKELGISLGKGYSKLPLVEKAPILKLVLDRPLRVCGVVPNTGEPGGGPFWVKQKDGRLSLQIVESAQVNMADPRQKRLFGKSTHFNPVDLVCSLRNWKGKLFDLKKYMDQDAVFISHKSSEGRELKALELPGLWNGAMADWITLFVEVPLETFNPVKTVFDLFKPRHQAKV